MCEDPGVPTDAQRTGDDFYDGGIVEFTCSPGLDMIGSRTLLCGGGKWNATVPSCEGIQYMRLHVVFWDSFLYHAYVGDPKLKENQQSFYASFFFIFITTITSFFSLGINTAFTSG